MTDIQQNQDADIDVTRYLDFVLRRRWIILSVWAIAMIATVAVTFTTTPIYQASALMEIEKERGGGGLYANSSMVESGNADYFETQYKLFQSNAVIQKAYQTLGLEKNAEFGQPGGAAKLRRAITISPIPRSRLLYVQAQSFDPAVAARIANAVSEAFVAENLNNQLFISKDILGALQSTQASPNARSLNESLPAVVNNTLIQTLKGDYSKLQSQYAEMSQRFTPKYPAMISLKSNMETLQKEIQIETERVVQSVKTQLSGQLQGNNARIIDLAEPPSEPIKPKKMKNLSVGLLGGIIFGIIVGYLVEIIDDSIRSQEDVEQKLHLPCLGAIPFTLMRSEESVYQNMISKEMSLSSESFRNLRTMVDFAGVSDKTNLLLVSSAVQEEGKSYVASNLAVAFAQTGERVLFIDGDLRRPKVHKNFRVSSKKGLSDFLARGSNAEEIAELIQASEAPNLKILTSGPRPPNPSELLNTPRLAALLAWANSQFDRVIVDCTPMFPINDTLLWGRHIRSGVFVTRYGKTRVPLVRNACQKLQTGGVKILGVAVNATTTGGLSYSPYSYYYQQYYHAYTQEAQSGNAA